MSDLETLRENVRLRRVELHACQVEERVAAERTAEARLSFTDAWNALQEDVK